MDQLTCPKPEQIAQYVLGTLDEDDVQQVSSHLAECPACQAVADQCDSASDPLIDMLRSPKPQSPYEAEPQCRRALERLTDIRRKYPWILQPGEGENPSGEGKDPSGGELELPRVLGEYLLFEYIGGNLGEVYKALHLELERLVALKMLPPSLVADEAAAQRFAREIRATGRLNHPNLVRAHDAREIAGRRFLVMEYVDGCDLDELVRRCGPLPIADACEVACQAAAGLQYVCQHGLVHRDIKPANLMLSREGLVKVLDLGLARFRISQQPSSTLQQPSGGDSTGPGMAMGTADYMAPEQVSDSHEVDIRADIYSLGCTLYKLLTGRAPFDGPEYETLLDKLNGHLRRAPIPVKQLRGDVPDGLAAVLSRMTAKNPAERFDTPEQVAAALKPFTEGCNVRALLGTTPREEPIDQESDNWLPPPPPRFWERVGLAAAAVILLVCGGNLALERFAPDWNRGARDIGSANQPRPGVQEAAPAPSGIEDQESETPPIVADPQTPASVSLPSTEPGVVAPGPAESKTAFAVRAELDRADGVYRGPPAGPDGEGELIAVTIHADQPGYLYLLTEQADGTLVCLFPNSHQAENRIEAGRPVTVPDPDAALALRTPPPPGTRSGAPRPSPTDGQSPPESAFTLRAGPPYGTETLLALVSREPLAPSRFGVASLTDRQFTRVDGEAVEQVRADIEADGDAGAEVELSLTTRPGDGPEAAVPAAPDPDPDAATEPITPPPESTNQEPDSEREDPKSKMQNPKSTGPVLVAGASRNT